MTYNGHNISVTKPQTFRFDNIKFFHNKILNCLQTPAIFLSSLTQFPDSFGIIIIQPNVDIWSMWTKTLKKRYNFYNLTYNKNLKD